MKPETFTNKLNQKHPGMFEPNFTYTGYNKDITLVCKKHGPITKHSRSFITGPGCSKCKEEQHLEKIKHLMKLLCEVKYEVCTV